MVPEVRVAPAADLREYGRIPIAFEVRSRFRVEPIDRGLGGFRLVEEPVAPPWVKDYDAADGERPADWAWRWDTCEWGMAQARGPDGSILGGAVIAQRTPGLEMLGGRPDRAVLWDLRVAPGWRGRGVGRALFRASASWAREQGNRELLIETQNVNVAACRFYAAQGCELVGVLRDAYIDWPDEVQMLWRLGLR